MLRRSLIILLLSVCCFASKKEQHGPISVSIHAPVDVIKANVVSYMTSAGYRIESDSQFQLSFWQEMKGGAGFATRLMLGNSYSEKPKYEITFQFSPSGGQITVDATAEISIKQAFGRVDRGDVTQGKARGQLVSMLDSIKSESEGQAIASSVPTPKTTDADYGVVRSKTPVSIAADAQKVFEALKKRGSEHGWSTALEGADYAILSHDRTATGDIPAGTYHLRFEVKADFGRSIVTYVLSASDQSGKLLSLTEQEQSSLGTNVEKALADTKSLLEPAVKQAAF